eukprot:7988226-Pyramimonas_sp.AAC.1
MAPVEHELRARRIRWYQRWVRNPKQHIAEWGARLGSMRVELANELPIVGGDARLTQAACPWARRFVDDISSLAELGGDEY